MRIISAAIHKGEGYTELPGNLSEADQWLKDIKKHLEITSLARDINIRRFSQIIFRNLSTV